MLYMMDWLKKTINHSGFQRYFFNTSWSLAENVLRLISGVFVGIYVARFLGPEKFGILSYAIAFVSIFSAVSKLGLDSIVVREIVEKPGKEAEILGTAFWLKLSGAVVMIPLTLLCLSFFEVDEQTRLYVFLIAIGLILQAFEVIEFYFQAKVQARIISICKSVHTLILAVLKIVMVIMNCHLFWFVFINLVSPVILAISMLFALIKSGWVSFLFSFSRKLAGEYLIQAMPLAFSGLVVMIYLRTDQIMIKSMLGEAEVGIYSAAVRISEVWYFIPMVIVSSLFPAIINGKKISNELYYSRLQNLFDLMVRLSLFFAIIASLSGNWLVLTLFGQEYAGSADILRIHLWTGIFVFLGVASSGWLVVENLQKHAFFRTFLGMMINIVLNYSLIPFWGSRGAAMAALMANFVAAFLYDLLFRSTRPIFYLKLKSILFYREIKCLINFATSTQDSSQKKD